MTELNISFPTEKLDALRFFMDKKQQNLEQELQDYVDKTYEKLVPPQVREYVESRMEQAQTDHQELTVQQTSTQQQVSDEQQAPIQQQAQEQDTEKTPSAKERPVRPPRRQKEQTVTGTPSAPGAQTETEGPTEQEEGQGMSMSM